MLKAASNKRFILAFVILIWIFIGAWFVIRTLDEHVSLYFTPTDVKEGKAIKGARVRFGGYVKPGSTKRLVNLMLEFVMTDGKNELVVRYNGVVPDLFREGQGVVAAGFINGQGILIADQLLVKHDAGYTPPVLPSGQERLEESLRRVFSKPEEPKAPTTSP